MHPAAVHDGELGCVDRCHEQAGNNQGGLRRKNKTQQNPREVHLPNHAVVHVGLQPNCEPEDPNDYCGCVRRGREVVLVCRYLPLLELIHVQLLILALLFDVEEQSEFSFPVLDGHQLLFFRKSDEPVLICASFYEVLSVDSLLYRLGNAPHVREKHATQQAEFIQEGPTTLLEITEADYHVAKERFHKLNFKLLIILIHYSPNPLGRYKNLVHRLQKAGNFYVVIQEVRNFYKSHLHVLSV